MAKIVLAWEAGAYLGHEMLVTAAAVLLKKAGHETVICAPHGAARNEAARRAGVRWEPAPERVTEPAAPAGVSWESRATTLWNFGFHSVEVIRERFHVWDVVLHREQPDVVLLQAAPFAQVAAHAGGFASVEFGIGFDVPPRQAPFPAFRGAEHFNRLEGLRLEQTILDRLAHVLGSRMMSASLHDLVSGQKRLVTSIRELDHYDGVDDLSREFVGPLPIIDLNSHRPKWRRGSPKVLAYLRAALIDVPKMLKSIAALQGDAVVVCMGADELDQTLASSLGIRMHLNPISLAALLPAADLVVSHGGGLMAEALIRGRPCLSLPSHYEQFLTAMTMKRRGLGLMLNPQQALYYEPALRHALADTSLLRNATAVSARYRGAVDQTGTAFVAAVESVMEETR